MKFCAVIQALVMMVWALVPAASAVPDAPPPCRSEARTCCCETSCPCASTPAEQPAPRDPAVTLAVAKAPLAPLPRLMARIAPSVPVVSLLKWSDHDALAPGVDSVPVQVRYCTFWL